jgi:hypothetical protein
VENLESKKLTKEKEFCLVGPYQVVNKTIVAALLPFQERMFQSAQFKI